jgi:hypothetical protein
LDLEFNPSTGKPHILGLASPYLCAAAAFNKGDTERLVKDILDHNLKMVGHAVMDADRPILQNVDIETPLEAWIDSMLEFYILNSHYCSAPGKEDNEDDPGALGLMNLWTCASQYTDLPQWKICRGAGCFGPCPEHEEKWYCAVDAWAGLQSHTAMAPVIAQHAQGKLLENLQKVAVYCGLMTKQGIKIDRDVIARLEEQIQGRKALLFPSEMRLRTERCKKETKVWLTPFNPNAPTQVAQYFKDHGVNLGAKGTTDRNVIRKALERELKKLHVDYTVDKAGGIELIEPELVTLPEPIEMLYNVDQYKRAGKGLQSWFDDSYFHEDGLLHPRFIVPGTITGRLASSNPNFQSIPRVGFGALVRAAVVPRSDKLRLAKMDKSQLELRVCLYYAGVQEDLGADAFAWLVRQSGGRFKAPADRLFNGKERDVAKSVSHAFDYLEGLDLVDPRDLAKDRYKKEIAYGARKVFDGCQGREEWTFRGQVVTFTGANLAERLFGDKGLGFRKQALEIQEIYAERFPSIRGWHKSLSTAIERDGCVQSITGRRIELKGRPADDLKLAAAFLGQGGGADEVQEHMRYAFDEGKIALAQIHDELVMEIDKSWSVEQAYKHFDFFVCPSVTFGGIVFPGKLSLGDNWAKYHPELNPQGLVELQ